MNKYELNSKRKKKKEKNCQSINTPEADAPLASLRVLQLYQSNPSEKAEMTWGTQTNRANHSQERAKRTRT
jgi:ATP sulfurylase